MSEETVYGHVNQRASYGESRLRLSAARTVTCTHLDVSPASQSLSDRPSPVASVRPVLCATKKVHASSYLRLTLQPLPGDDPPCTADNSEPLTEAADKAQLVITPSTWDPACPALPPLEPISVLRVLLRCTGWDTLRDPGNSATVLPARPTIPRGLPSVYVAHLLEI